MSFRYRLPQFVLIWLIWVTVRASAHPLDSFATDQYVDISMASGEVTLVHRIEFAEIPTVAEFPKADTNSDTTLSDDESASYLQSFQEVLSRELVLIARDQPVPLAYQRGEVLLQEIPAPRLKVITSHKGKLASIVAAGVPFQFDLKHRAGARGDRQIRLLCAGFLQLGSVWSSDPKQPIGMAPPVVAAATALVYGHTTRWVLLPSPVEHRPSLSSIPSSSRAVPLQPPDPFLSLNPRGFEVQADALSARLPLDASPDAAPSLERESPPVPHSPVAAPSLERESPPVPHSPIAAPSLERESLPVPHSPVAAPPLERESLPVPHSPAGTRRDSRSSDSKHSSNPEPSSDADSLTDAALPKYSEGAQGKPNRETWADSQFRGLFTANHQGGISFLLFTTLLSLIYGAAHAMEPGHGKTIVAAYLVGSNGTVFHAVLLALIVTFTHTFSVYILGLIALTNLDRVQGTYLPWLECGSWALIVFMGLVLFLRYYRAYAIGDLADPNYHTHGLGRGHSHAPHFHEDHSHDHGHDHPHPTHDEDHEHDHHHAHDRDHVHEHSHVHPHPHVHEHHSHGPEGDGERPGEAPDRVSYWNLLTLGVTGGIVPCPGALFVMMLALTSGRAAAGLYLITVFSIGLAAALMTVGIVMVRSRRLFDRYSPNSRFVQLLPVLSSVVILLVGTGFLVNGLVKYGILEIHLG